MELFIAALVAPLMGPVLYGALHDRPRAVRAVDGFVYLSVPILVFWQVAPYAWAERSAVVPLALAAGFVLPLGFERASRALEAHTDNLAIVVGLSGLALHALLEGVAFGPGAERVGGAFALAVILHRIPVGLVIWWLLRPRHGAWLAGCGVAVIVLATALGYGVGVEWLGIEHGVGTELYQAFVSGSLVHVVFHQGRHDHQHAEHEHHV